MPQEVPKPGEFRVSDLSAHHPTTFDLVPDAAERAAIAERLGLVGLRKLRFHGTIAPAGAREWHLLAELGATVVQPCVVTLEPVVTRIDETIERRYLPADLLEPEDPAGETEMPDDTDTEPLGTVISARAAMIESLLLAVPDYPRATQAALGEAVFSEDGTDPLTDADTKPFAGLAALRDKLDKKS